MWKGERETQSERKRRGVKGREGKGQEGKGKKTAISHSYKNKN
jgi:hypothetical protein